MDLKKYFRVITKPVALTSLFFIVLVWLYFVFAPILKQVGILRIRNPEAVSEELARLSTFETFLAGILRGDFGYSSITGDFISREIGPRLQLTIGLIALAIVLFFVTSIMAILIASLYKPKTSKPQAFGHSLRNYLFGLTPFLGFVLLIVFSYNLKLLPRYGIYPLEWAMIYRDTGGFPPNLLEQISGRFPYFVLPSVTLAFVFLVRNLMVVWSGSSSVISEAWRKRILFAFATIDFPLIISAVVLVEWIFTITGAGHLLFSSILWADYNGMIGAFIILFALTVVLGFASTALDFLLHFSGLYENLEKKASQELAVSEKQGQAEGKKLRNMLQSFWKRRSLLAGSIILIFFVLLGLFAPLITPYDPVQDVYLASDFARPSWLPQLTGQSYCPSMNPIDDPSFNGPIGDRNITADTQITYQPNALEGMPEDIGGSGPGCLTLTFSTIPQGTQNGQAAFKIEYSFEYSQSAPQRFSGKLAWKANVISAGSTYRIGVYIATPVSRYRLFDSGTRSEGTAESWLSPQPPIDSYETSLRQQFERQLGVIGVDPAREIFKAKGLYTYSVEIVFQNTYSLVETQSIRIDLDDVDFRTFGDIFGLLGTDQQGRDVCSQLLYGIRTILVNAVPLATLATLIGFAFGLMGGYFQGWADNITMTFVDAIYFIPALPFLIAIIMLYGPSFWIIPGLWIMPLLLSAPAAYAFRNTYLMQPENSKLRGNSSRNMLLNLTRNLIAGFSLTMMSLVLVLPAVEFSGLYDPALASWGRTIHDALSYAGIERWWWSLSPFVFMGLLALGFFLLGSTLVDRFK